MAIMLILLDGCAPTSEKDPIELRELLESIQAEADAALAGELVHDLGPVLSGDQVVHEFRLRNPTKRPLRVLAVEARTPCCSRVEKLPESVASGGEAGIEVVFRPGSQVGRRSVEFVITTDNAARQKLTYVLVAQVVPEVEVKVLDGTDCDVILGQSGRQMLRVTCIRTSERGRGLPESVFAAEPLSARLVGETAEEEFRPGWIRASRNIALQIPPSNALGRTQAMLELSWPNGLKHAEPVVWRVREAVEAVPPSLVVADDSSIVTQTIRLSALDRPFRVTGILGESLAEPYKAKAPTLARAHTLSISIRTGTHSPDEAPIIIQTDHPLQPTIKIRILRRGFSGGRKS
jgi:hypothetical protein